MSALARKDGIPYVSVIKAMCRGGDCQMTGEDGLPLEFDVVHLTADGSAFVAKRIASDIFEKAAS